MGGSSNNFYGVKSILEEDIYFSMMGARLFSNLKLALQNAGVKKYILSFNTD